MPAEAAFAQSEEALRVRRQGAFIGGQGPQSVLGFGGLVHDGAQVQTFDQERVLEL